MEGIEVLDKIEITTLQNWVIYGFLISLGITILFAIIMKLLEYDDSIASIIVTLIDIIAMVATIFFMIMIPAAPKKYTGIYKYVISVDDDVNFNEFYNKYDIIGKEKYSNIYTVKERIEE